MINRCFKEACTPICLKVGKQTPIFKGGDNVITNFRPITVVNSIIARIFEKSVSSKLVKYLERFEIYLQTISSVFILGMRPVML